MNKLEFITLNSIKMLFPLVLFMTMSCHAPEQRVKIEKFYDAYNIFTIQGENEVKPSDNYPFISLVKDSGEIIVRHYFGKDSVIENKYLKADSFYRRKIEFNAGMSSMEFEELHFADKIIILHFNTSIKKSLSSISEYKNNILTSYIFKKELPGDLDVGKYLAMINTDQVYAIYKIAFSKINEEILVRMNFENKMNNELSETRIIKFMANGKSLNWWLIFKWGFYFKSLIYIDDYFLPAYQ